MSDTIIHSPHVRPNTLMHDPIIVLGIDPAVYKNNGFYIQARYRAGYVQTLVMHHLDVTSYVKRMSSACAIILYLMWLAPWYPFIDIILVERQQVIKNQKVMKISQQIIGYLIGAFANKHKCPVIYEVDSHLKGQVLGLRTEKVKPKTGKVSKKAAKTAAGIMSAGRSILGNVEMKGQSQQPTGDLKSGQIKADAIALSYRIIENSRDELGFRGLSRVARPHDICDVMCMIEAVFLYHKLPTANARWFKPR